MTDRGLPIVDGAPACPFVAFDDDRDARDTAPDHRHRCYAEVRPAPRALAHQEAYCLSSAFPVCPTFQDWARREAAQARTAGTLEGSDGVRDADAGSADRSGPVGGSPGVPARNPHRDWAAPPPWLNDRGREPEEGDEAEIQPRSRTAGGGLVGSYADRLVGGSTSRPGMPPASRDADAFESDDDGDEAEDNEAPAPARRGLPPTRPSRPGPASRSASRDRGRGAGHVSTGGTAPSWERPRRLEAYPTLRTRLGLPAFTVPPILVGVAAVALAAVALFFLPALLGIGNPPDSGATPTPGASASAGASGTLAPPTPTPGPTLQVYVVESGDTMSRIATRFGIPLSVLIEANAETIPNPDLLKPGDQVIIPSIAPTSLPDAGTVTEAPTTTP
ncbi:MAG TPA: LysM domain-containing protein [Candidatus Sulfomarinibacteraceae bacterium]|nr:LysM domain-containing protein [Candidatus Sulfomarinibacteraceae bacterium]